MSVFRTKRMILSRRDKEYKLRYKNASRARYVTARKKRSDRNCGHNCQFYIVFFENCEIFFRTLGPLYTCPSIRAGCIDWFRNHPRVKQIYRIIVKKNKHDRQDRFVETTNNALGRWSRSILQSRFTILHPPRERVIETQLLWKEFPKNGEKLKLRVK